MLFNTFSSFLAAIIWIDMLFRDGSKVEVVVDCVVVNIVVMGVLGVLVIEEVDCVVGASVTFIWFDCLSTALWLWRWWFDEWKTCEMKFGCSVVIVACVVIDAVVVLRTFLRFIDFRCLNTLLPKSTFPFSFKDLCSRFVCCFLFRLNLLWMATSRLARTSGGFISLLKWIPWFRFTPGCCLLNDVLPLCWFPFGVDVAL